MGKIFDEMRRIGENPSQNILSEKEIEDKLNFSVPKEILKIWNHFRGPVVFEKEILFLPIEKSGFEDENGFVGLEVIYGPNVGSNGILAENEAIHGRLPDALVAVAGVAGGNYVALDRKTGRIFLWLHDDWRDGYRGTLIASSMKDFVRSLKTSEAKEENFDFQNKFGDIESSISLPNPPDNYQKQKK